MLFAFSIENTDIHLGVFDGDVLVFDSRVAASLERSADEYAILFQNIFSMYGVSVDAIDAAVFSSVVRPLSHRVGSAVEKLTREKPLQVGPGVRTGLSIRTEIASQVGADIVANAVAAASLVPSPMVFVDFGTATTLTGINGNGELCGVLICPGTRTSLEALSAGAAELPRIAVDNPRGLFGKNTIDSMTNGIVYGQAAMVDGLLARIAEEWCLADLTVLATGEWADRVVPHCRRKEGIRLVPELTLLGLKRIHEMNSRPRP
jgi:type III pantothenate kinase